MENLQGSDTREEEASSITVEGEDAMRQRVDDLTEELQQAKTEIQMLKQQVLHQCFSYLSSSISLARKHTALDVQ